MVVVVGGAHEGKRPSAGRLVKWLENIQHPIVLIGGPEDKADADRIAANIPCENWVGQLSVHQSAHVLKLAEMVVTGDTGMMHIASAWGKKIVSLWGCTTPQLGMSAYRGHQSSAVLEPIGRRKRPCSKLGNRCKYGIQNKCIDQISVEHFQEAIERSWAQ
jgi:heptosyltransferase-2